MIRQATETDIAVIGESYTQLLTYEQEQGGFSNWQLGVYPTVQVAEARVPRGGMYVLVEAGELCASMVLNREQAPEYADVSWAYRAEPTQVLVIHTLCIPPQCAGHGYGTQMVRFAQDYARLQGCTVIRLDTYAHNEPTKHLYRKLGFRIAGWGRMRLQGLIDEEQVYAGLFRMQVSLILTGKVGALS